MAKLRVDKIASVGVSTETTGSVFFDDSGDRLDIAIGTDLDLGTADFTIELWWYKADSGNNYAWTLGDAKLSTGLELYVGSTGSATNVYTNNAAQITAETNPSANEWHHYAVVRESGTLKLYIDGVQDPSTYDASSADFGGAGGFLYIGAEHYNSAFNYDGLKYISNFRVVKGKALYTSNFAVPTRELEVTPETVLVACHDGEDIFAEKTGKIIAAYGDRLSSPTPTATDSPIGITTFQPGLTRDVDVTAGPVFQGGAAYASQNWLTLPKGTTTERGGDRGLFGGGYNTGSTRIQTIEYINISTSGIALNFGDLIEQHTDSTGNVASSTRGLFGGGANSPPTTKSDTIEHITMSSTGNGVDFGNLSAGRRRIGSLSNKTRGIFGPGEGDPSNTSQIDFVTIATLGNASDFGDMDRTTEPNEFYATLSSPTRGIFAGGERFDGTVINIIDYITISSLGDAQNFGDLLAARRFVEGCSSQTRGIIAGGTTPSAYDNVIQYITISTLGDAQDFGDLSTSTVRDPHMTSNSIRGVFAGGEGSPALINTIEYVVITSTGNAKDFGDLLDSRRSGPSASNSHGGIS